MKFARHTAHKRAFLIGVTDTNAAVTDRNESAPMTDIDAALMALGDQRFVSLTTFRRTGARVSTPVWIARDGHALVVTTPAGSGKVKRLRRDPRVELQPCSRTGRVDEADVPVAGTAEIHTDNDVRTRSSTVIRKKYRIEYRLVMLIERLVSRRNHGRVILRITPPGAAQGRSAS